jgi:hypothetical protein
MQGDSTHHQDVEVIKKSIENTAWVNPTQYVGARSWTLARGSPRRS